ncbi:hypothetical protein M1D89_01540 (plasmid) [Arthrobacter sp. D3-18]
MVDDWDLSAKVPRAYRGFAPIVNGHGLILIHLVSIWATNTSVIPPFAGPEALGQVRLFITGPLVDAAIAGFTYAMFFPNTQDVVLER